MASTQSEDAVHGFTAWMKALRLDKYIALGAKWIDENGAASLQEVYDNREDFAEALNLKRLERKRLEGGIDFIAECKGSRCTKPEPPSLAINRDDTQVQESPQTEDEQTAAKGTATKGKGRSDAQAKEAPQDEEKHAVATGTMAKGKGKGVISAEQPEMLGSSSKQTPCRYGANCRGLSNVEHCKAFSHPLDQDSVASDTVAGAVPPPPAPVARRVRVRPCKFGAGCKNIKDQEHLEEYSHPGVEMEVSKAGEMHVGTKYPQVACADHPGCPRRTTCRWSHGLVHSAAAGGTKATCFLGQPPHNQSCSKPTWNGDDFQFCSKECREKSLKTPKGADGCARKECPCPVTINGKPGQYCCEECAKGKACRAPRHTLPTAHLVAVAAPQAGKYQPCARSDCCCAVEGGSSWSGKEGQFCCRACRKGTPCTKLWHTMPQAEAAALVQKRYTGNECPLAGCSKPPWNGKPGEYCCREHKDSDTAASASKAAAEKLAVPAGTFPDFAALWTRAQSWARKCGVGAMKGPVSAVYLNESLANPACPARVSFERAVAKAKLRSWADGEFGWHGTKSLAGLQGICWSSWKTEYRSGQACGPGEYFSRGTTPGLHYSEGYAGGDAANFLIVAYIISAGKGAAPRSPDNGSCSGGAGHIVCNNPVKGGNVSTGVMYCVPIAVVAFGKAGAKPSFT